MTGRNINGFVPYRDMPPGGMSIARLACGLFTKPSHFNYF